MLLFASVSLIVTFFPRMSSRLMSPFVLSRSIWYSLTRLSSSRACMVWNNSTSVPSGVAISMTLATVHRRDRLRSLHHQPCYRCSRLHPQLRFDDVVSETRGGEQPFDVRARMTVAPVKFEPVVASRLPNRVLQREDQHTAGPQRTRTGGDHVVEHPEIHE